MTYHIAVRVDDFANTASFIDWAFHNRVCQMEQSSSEVNSG